MTTRIQSLFLVRAAFVIADNEDWADALAFFDTAGAPIPLDGITFRTIVRTARDSHAAYLGLASPGVTLDLPTSTPRGVMLTGGASGNVLAFTAAFGEANRPQAGSYVLDTLAFADGLTRRIVDGTITIERGIS